MVKPWKGKKRNVSVNNSTTTVYLPPDTLRDIEMLISQEKFLSRSELVRTAVREYIKNEILFENTKSKDKITFKDKVYRIIGKA